MNKHKTDLINQKITCQNVYK